MTTSVEEFNPLAFEKRLTQLKDTQESIQSLSSWCLQKRQHHKKIVSSWLNVLKRAKVEHRLTLFYLANDVIQYSKRKNYEFVESWGTTLQKATPLVRDDKVKHRILRIFRIWEERAVYDEEFLTDLTGLLSAAAGKQTPDIDPNDFQAIQLVNKVRQCSVLEADTDMQMKLIHENPLALKDADALCSSLKERRDVDEAKQELDDGVSCLEGYVRALQKELVARAALCRLLQRAHHHYTTQRGEVKVVANAYKNFGGRVRGLKRKLDELCVSLPPSAKSVPPAVVPSSPVPSPPSPGETVPSPGPDEDIDLPGQHTESYNLDKTFSASILGDELVGIGFTSFMGQGDFPFFQKDDPKDDKGGNKIEVISSRPVATPREDFNINEFLKSLIPTKKTPSNNVEEPPAYRGRVLPSPPAPPPPLLLPGLDLLAPPPPPPLQTNFYGTANKPETPEPVGVPAPEVYVTDHGAQWNNTWENLQPTQDTPESPPPASSPPVLPRYTEGPPPAPRPDVDHRTLMAPPPPPRLPPLMLEGDDVDHRMLPPLPKPVVTSPSQNDRNRLSHKVGDVDHRNLISLTGALLPPPAPPISPWTPHSEQNDQDYRSMGADVPVMAPSPTPPNPPRLSLNMPQHTPNKITHQSKKLTQNSPTNMAQHPQNNITSPHSPGNITLLPVNNMSHLPPNMLHHSTNSNMHLIPHPPAMPQHLTNMSQHLPNMPQHPPIMSQHPPSIPQHSPNMSQLPPNMSRHASTLPQHASSISNHKNMSQIPPNMSQLPPNIPPHAPNMSHHAPNMSQHPPNILSHPPPSVPDNVESIDMEMSDDENYDDEYNRHSRLEMTLARLHGNPPPQLMSRLNQQPPQPFRKSDHPREQNFNNNNKILVGGNMQQNLTPVKPSAQSVPHRNEQGKPVNIDSGNSRSNLVRINSIPDDAKEKKDSPSTGKDLLSELLLSDEEDISHDNLAKNKSVTLSPVKDVFSDSLNNAMNPTNPNLNETKDSLPDRPETSPHRQIFHKVSQHPDDDVWEEDEDISHEEPQKWRQQMGGMNPMRPNFVPGVRPFQMRGPRGGFRHPSQMFNRPPPPERFFNPERGRRPWGPRHHRGFW